MATNPAIPLRFQRAEFEAKADLSPAGLGMLASHPHPIRYLETLRAAQLHEDAIRALVLMLPHREVVWLGCLAAQILPGLDQRKPDAAAIEAAEKWVRSGVHDDAELAGEAAARANNDFAPAWVATAAFWAGPSLVARGMPPVAPAPHLPGMAVRTALILLMSEPALQGRVRFADWLDLGVALMHGGNGIAAQTELRRRLFEA